MDWRKKTVSMGLVDTEEFDLELVTVTVSENRLRAEPKDVEDWERIFTELGADTVLEEVHWSEVRDVSITVNELYYPHIDITLERQPEEGDNDLHKTKVRRIYFTEDEREKLEDCFSTIKRFWNRWRQNTVMEDDRFPDELKADEDMEEVELKDALREQQESTEVSADKEDVPQKEQEAQSQTVQTESESEEQMVMVEQQTDDERRAADQKADEQGADEDVQEQDAKEEDGDGDEDEEDEIEDVVDRFMEQ